MAKSSNKVKARITIELVTEEPSSGSGLPDLAEDAYIFKQQIPEIVWRGRDGERGYRMGDKYRVSWVKIEQEIRATD